MKNKINVIKVIQLLEEFIDKQNITCSETIYQTDRVVENVLPLLEDLCNEIGYKDI
ncbi:MAG: hypothetical protein KDH96_10660 [Candidatus Riesia sp.]|nr:hypothetical protein [Candidatus Riesia sp.]